MSKIKSITKRSSASVFRQSSPASNSLAIVSSLNNLSSDIGQILTEFAKVRTILNSGLMGAEDSITGLDSSLDMSTIGLDGSVVLVKRSATSSDPEYMYSVVLSRPITIKEALAEIYISLTERIDTVVQTIVSPEATDTSDIEDDINSIRSFIGAVDSFVPTYSDHAAGLTTISNGDSLEKAVALVTKKAEGLLEPSEISTTYDLTATTTGVTITRLLIKGSGENVLLAVNSANVCEATVVCIDLANGNIGTWTLVFSVKVGINIGTIQVRGTVTKVSLDKDLPGVDISPFADITSGAAGVQVTGIAGQTYRWNAILRVTSIEI